MGTVTPLPVKAAGQIGFDRAELPGAPDQMLGELGHGDVLIRP